MKNNKINLYKLGNFYNAYNDDGIILHFLFGYRYIDYKKSTGFPQSALTKIKTKLEMEKINYVIYEKNNKVAEFKGINKNYQSILKKALKKIDVEVKMERVKQIIDNLNEQQLDKLIEVIENGNF